MGFLLSSHKLMKHVGGWITRGWTRYCLQLACAFGKLYPRSKPLFPQANQTRLNAKGTIFFSWIIYLILLTAFMDYHIYCTNLWYKICGRRFVDLFILFICIYLQAKPILYAFDGARIENSSNVIFLIKPIGPY